MNHDPYNAEMAAAMTADHKLREQALSVFIESYKYRYSYNFTWLGRPIIQYPEDIIALQEIIWRVRPRLIIETGVAHGGSSLFFATLLELLGGDGMVAAIELDLRSHNRAAIQDHPMSKRVTIFDGSSTDPVIARKIHDFARKRDPVMVVLDSDHTHAHVLRELMLYSDLVKTGSYIVVLDTIIEFMPPTAFPDRPWGKGNNPFTAVSEFLVSDRRFAVDSELESTLLLSSAPGGYLRCREN